MEEPELIPYDEFSFFAENAEEFGLPYPGPPTVRREEIEVAAGRRLSSLVWGDGEPQLVLIHGGAQNAHTWDTVALALGVPLLAVDMPGHGHSDSRPEGLLDPEGNAVDVAVVIRELAPRARAVVGMSLGGLTSLALSRQAPELVASLVLVDITPGVDNTKSSHITAFVNGPARFEDFDEILARTVEYNPTRSVSSLRRGILHNAQQLPDGGWVWRHARFSEIESDPDRAFARFNDLWPAVSELSVPLMLVRGVLDGSVVDDEDEAELRRRRPDARVEHVAAGHSIQGDAPVELARLLADFALG